MNKKKTMYWLKRVTAVASGATLLQAGGCAVDTEALVAQIVPQLLNALLSGLLV